MSLIILTGTDEAFSAKVQEAISNLPAVLRNVEDPVGPLQVDAIASLLPAVVILGPSLRREAAFGFASKFDRSYPAISILVASEPGGEVWKTALRAGVRGVIDPAAEPGELSTAIEEALQASERRRTQVRVPSGSQSKVITVVSPKGGVGKTVLSTNIAVGLASRNATGVSLIDLDLRFGDVSHALMLAPQHTMLDAVSALPDLTSTQLKVFLASHTSGLFTLCAPDDPAEGDGIGAADTTEVIKLAASLFGHVVIDTGAGLDEHTLAAIELCTELIVVSDMDVPSVRNVRKALDTLDLLGLNDHRRIFVLNRANSRVGIKKDDVEAAASLPIDLEIPSARAVPQSLNDGRPIILSSPRSPVSRRISMLVAELLSDGMAPARTLEKEVDHREAQ